VNCAADRASCGCPQQFVNQKTKTAVFENLQCSKRYFPMISLNRPQAIYGFPPLSKYPASSNRRIVSEEKGGEVVPSPGKDLRPLASDHASHAALDALNTTPRHGGSDHHDHKPSLSVKRPFSDEPDPAKVEGCKKLKISQLVENPAQR
jgi:hypothetical protein